MMAGSTARVEAAFAAAPVVAILRGLPTADAVAVVETLFDAGIRVAEVPLNSPTPFDTIALLVRHFGTRMVIGAGTVRTAADVDYGAEAGGAICVSPNCEPAVIARALERGMVPMPGVASPSEAFRAYDAGARWLKYFPAGEQGLATIQALLPVMPADVRFVAVGGVGAANCASFLSRGCRAIGVGSELYRAASTKEAISAAARQLVAATRATAAPAAVRIAHPGATIGESPLIDRGSEALYFVDPVECLLHRIGLSDGASRPIALDVPIHAIGWRGDTLIGIGDDMLCEIDADSGATRRIAAIDVGSGCRLNDMTVDRDGVVWAGSMHRGLLVGRGTLFRIDPSGAVAVASTGHGVCNGIAVSPDGGSLNLIDTLSRTLIQFPRIGTGAGLGEPVIKSDFMNIPGKPDGMAVDRDGNFLVAMWGGGLVAELLPDGALRRRHPLPAPHVSSLCIAANGDLLVTTSRMRLSPDDPQMAGSGAVYRIARG